MKRSELFDETIFDLEDEFFDDPMDLVPVDLHPLVPGFLDRREKEVAELFDLLKRNDFFSIKEVAHKLKGNGAGYGFQRISDIGREMESAASMQDVQRIKQSVEELKMITENLKEVLRLRQNF